MGESESAPTRRPCRPARVLLLFADTGGGHRASAQAVASALRDAPEGLQVELLDPFAEASPTMVSRIVELYSPLIRRAPWAWGAGYHLTDSRAGVRVLRSVFLRFVEPGLAARVAALEPDAVVSFHPLLNDVAAAVLRRGRGPRPSLITVVTDLVDVHASWTCPDVDAVVTASPGGLDHCRRAGIPAHRCFDLGLPVDASFGAGGTTPAERAPIRRDLGLEPDRFTVLLTGGGEGSGGLRRRVAALSDAGLPVQLVAVCGRNRALHERLGVLRPRLPATLRVLGFVPNMSQWMRAADVVITKAGPGTIAEALCCGTPMLLTSYVPGQERGNVALVVDTGSGRWVPRLRDLVGAVEELAQPGSAALAAMREALVHAARPTAARRVADLVRSMALQRATAQ